MSKKLLILVSFLGKVWFQKINGIMTFVMDNTRIHAVPASWGNAEGAEVSISLIGKVFFGGTGDGRLLSRVKGFTPENVDSHLNRAEITVNGLLIQAYLHDTGNLAIIVENGSSRVHLTYTDDPKDLEP